MTTFFRCLSRLTTALAVLIASAGCSPKAKVARHLDRAGRYYHADQYPRAELEYRNALQIENLNPDAISGLAVIYFDQGRLGRVYPILLKARELQPANLDVRFRLGMFQLATGQFRAAYDEALFVLDHMPDHPEAPTLLAESAVLLKEIEPALARLQKLPDSAPVQVALGTLYFRQQDLSRALAAFERARQLDPQSTAASLALGSYYMAQGDSTQAEPLFVHAASHSSFRSAKRMRYAQFLLKADRRADAKHLLEEMNQKAPDYLPAWLLRAEIAATEGRHDESLAALNKILLSDPLHLEASLLHARMSYSKGEKDKAVAELERTATIFPQAPQVHYQLGMTYVAMGMPDKAATSLERALTLAPDVPGAILLLAEINVRRGNLPPAIAALTQLVQQHPELAQARLLLGQAYRSQGKLDDALSVYRELESSFQRNPQGPLLSGLVLRQQRKDAAAKEAFARSLEYDPNFIPALEQLVNFDLAAKDYAAAARRIEALIARTPDTAAPYLLLAKVRLAEGNTAQAEAALLKMIELGPEAPLGYYLLARIYLDSDRREKALENLQLVLARNPGNMPALMLTATIQEQLENYPAARDTYEKILAINPAFSAAINNLAYIYCERLGDREKALSLAQKARALLPAEPHTADTLGWILFRKGDYEWALSLVSEAAERLPESADVQYHLGMIHYMLGQDAAARTALERALTLSNDFEGIGELRRSLRFMAIDPATATEADCRALETAAAQGPDPVALIRLGAIRERSGKTAEASAAYETALKVSPANVPAALNVIRMHVRRNDPAKALELAKTTRKMAPDNPDIAHLLGQLAFQSGDHPWAFSLLQEVARKQPDDPEVLYDYARFAYSVGQVSAAESAMRSAWEGHPNFQYASGAKAFLAMLAVAASPATASSADAQVDAALKADPFDLPALIARASLCAFRANPAAARQAYETALSRYPRFTPALRELALIYSADPAQDQKTIELGTDARRAFPEDAQLAKALGIALHRQHNESRAVALLQESSRRLSTDAEVFFYLGMAQRQMNDAGPASESLRRALALGLPADLAAQAQRALEKSGSSTASN